MISNTEIRARARGVLGGNILKPEWLFPVLLLFIIAAISTAAGITYVGPIVLAGVLSCASAGYFLGRVRSKVRHENIGTALDCVRNDLTGSMITGIVTNLIVAIGYVLLVVPGVILSYSFAMVYFIRIDHPEMGTLESLKESARLMKGHKIQFFLLQLSFIGWMLLAIMCIGVGSIWVNAYIQTANAIFYEQLIAEDGNYYNA